MKSLAMVTLTICSAVILSSAWELDTVSPATFTPLAVGNEWIYFDSSWLESGANPSIAASSDSLIRKVAVVGNFADDDGISWVAAVEVKGIRTTRHPDGRVVTAMRDTSFSDTLSMPPNGYFAPSTDSRLVSWGMIALFPWFAFEEPCSSSSVYGITTTISLEHQEFGDSLMRITGSTHQLYGTEATHTRSEITVRSGVGMVRGTREFHSLANNVYCMGTRILSFNGEPIDPALYSIAVVVPPAVVNRRSAAGKSAESLLTFTSDRSDVRHIVTLLGQTGRGLRAAGLVVERKNLR